MATAVYLFDVLVCQMPLNFRGKPPDFCHSSDRSHQNKSAQGEQPFVVERELICNAAMRQWRPPAPQNWTAMSKDSGDTKRRFLKRVLPFNLLFENTSSRGRASAGMDGGESDMCYTLCFAL
jgi:hypothetical protein